MLESITRANPFQIWVVLFCTCFNQSTLMCKLYQPRYWTPIVALHHIWSIWTCEWTSVLKWCGEFSEGLFQGGAESMILKYYIFLFRGWGGGGHCRPTGNYGYLWLLDGKPLATLGGLLLPDGSESCWYRWEPRRNTGQSCGDVGIADCKVHPGGVRAEIKGCLWNRKIL